MKISLNIVTPDRTVFEKTVDSVTVTTEQGEITVLPEHIPLLATLKAGEAHVRMGKDEHFFAHSSGFIEVSAGNNVRILAESAENADELDLATIESARDLAKSIMENKAMDEVAFADAASALERELARHRVATKNKYRKIPQRPGETS